MKEKKYTQISTDAPVKRISFILSLVTWTGSFFMTLINRVKIIKRDKLPKPPFILISTHASMLDFYVALRLTFPHRSYWISTVEEFVPRYFIFRNIGVLAKRKFTNDPVSAMRYLDVLQKKKKTLIFYPEARYSFTGEEERIDKSLGRFVKTANVPLVFMKNHGHYLYCPQWSDRKNRKVRPITCEVETLVTKADLEVMSAQDIQDKIESKFHISEEEWMQKKNIQINYEDRAVGLHKILYKCPHCGAEFEMSSESHFLKCNHCGVTYDYLPNGQLKNLNGESKFIYPSQWYKWEKECVKEEIIKGTYHYEDGVRVEKLMGAKIGFVPLEGKYHLSHSIEGGIDVKGEGNDFHFHRSSLQSFGLHIEYNYIGRGAFLELADTKDTYFVYPLSNPDIITKMHFAVEHIYDLLKDELKN